MRTWIATPEELNAEFLRMHAAHHLLAPVETTARIAFHDGSQEAARIIIPAPRFMAALMAGGFVTHKRQIGACPTTGLPEFEGTGEIMPAMTHDEALSFVAWKDMPKGANRFVIMDAADLPRIDGSAEAARLVRAAWQIGEAA